MKFLSEHIDEMCAVADDIHDMRSAQLELKARCKIINMRDGLFRSYLVLGHIFAISQLPGGEELKMAMANDFKCYGTTKAIGVDRLIVALESWCPPGYERRDTTRRRRK